MLVFTPQRVAVFRTSCVILGINLKTVLVWPVTTTGPPVLQTFIRSFQETSAAAAAVKRAQADLERLDAAIAKATADGYTAAEQHQSAVASVQQARGILEPIRQEMGKVGTIYWLGP